MSLNELRDKAYQCAVVHGWHEEEHSDSHLLMLIITEIAEAVQADRKNLHADVEAFKKYEEIIDFKENFERLIKNTVEEELSDVVIRCLDLLGLRGIDIDGDCEPDSPPTGDTFTEDSFWICAAITRYEYPLKKRLCDTIAFAKEWAYIIGIDIDFFIRTKMKYNRLRGYHHGGKRY